MMKGIAQCRLRDGISGTVFVVESASIMIARKDAMGAEAVRH